MLIQVPSLIHSQCLALPTIMGVSTRRPSRALLGIILGWVVLAATITALRIDVHTPTFNGLAIRSIAARQDDGTGDIPIEEPGDVGVPSDGEDPAEPVGEAEPEIEYNPPPTEDPWYDAPEGWEDAEPGTVLKTRPEGLADCPIAYCAGTYQFLYKSADTHNNDSWAVATIFYSNITAPGCDDPENMDDCVQAVVTYDVAYDSSSLDGSPSYLMQWGDPYGEMVDLLKRAYFVMLPDYEGPKAAYCSGPQAGRATLDAIRGIKNVGHEVGIKTDTAKYTIWGYSGGAFAAGLTAEMAEEYAPELEIAGAIVGGTAPNITSAFLKMNGQDTAGLVINGLIGITAQWEEERAFMMDRLKKEGPYNATGFFRATGFASFYVLYGYAGQDVYNYFENGEEDILQGPIRQLFDTEGAMGIHGIPNMPTFIYKAEVDEMSGIEETDVMVDYFCENGANILYHRNSLGDHNKELWAGRLRALDFISKVSFGVGEIEIPEKGCLIQNVTVDLPDWNEIEVGRALRGVAPAEPEESGAPGDADGGPVGEPVEEPVEQPVEEPRGGRKNCKGTKKI